MAFHVKHYAALASILLVGCTAPTDMTKREPQRLAWSDKSMTVGRVVVEMNTYGLLKLRIDDEIVAHRVNWCVQRVESENE